MRCQSNKVVPGTAFYGRAFAATSTSCLEPGCTFESAATMGDRSRENGIWLNSEIVDILDTQGVKPTLDKKSGVKIATGDSQWVAYDDEETLELKAQFSLGLGLGGVMVWAVSRDTPTQRFSNSFIRRAANRNGLTSTTESNSTRYVETHKVIDQCKWTNCGKTCPAGYQPALRTDENAAENEVMLDKTACDGDLHILCCPEKAMATCGWYIHINSFSSCLVPTVTPVVVAAGLNRVLWASVVADYQDFWNEVCDKHGFQYLKFPEFRKSLEDWFGNIFEDITTIIDTIKCRFEDVNDLISPNAALACEDEDPCEGDDADCESEEWDDPCPEAEVSLDKRGRERTYCINNSGTTMRSR
ncbi:hypothetical protein BJX62DRAFT_244588 [Aspergillus germanicus]